VKASRACTKATSCVVSQVGEYIYLKPNQNKVLSDSEFDTENGRSCFSLFCHLPQNQEKPNVHWENMQTLKSIKEKFLNVVITYRNKTRKRTDQLSVRIQLIEGLFVKHANAIERKVPHRYS
jgi:hypothetical protein